MSPTGVGIKESDGEWGCSHICWRMPSSSTETSGRMSTLRLGAEEGLIQPRQWFGKPPSLPKDLFNLLGYDATTEQNDAPTNWIPWLQVPCSCHMTMATSAVPHRPKEFNQEPQSSPRLTFELTPGPEGCPTWWIKLTTGSRCRWEGKEGTLVGGRNLDLFTGAAWWTTPAMLKP